MPELPAGKCEGVRAPRPSRYGQHLWCWGIEFAQKQNSCEKSVESERQQDTDGVLSKKPTRSERL